MDGISIPSLCLVPIFTYFSKEDREQRKLRRGVGDA